MSPAEAEQSNALSSYFSSYSVNKYPFHGLFSVMFLHFYGVSLLVILFFKWPPMAVLNFWLVFLNAGRHSRCAPWR